MQRDIIQEMRLHVLPTDRFKTYSITVFIGIPLQEDTVTSTAVLPFVLRRGNTSYPLTEQFRARLEDLYGAGFGFDVYKRGDYQIVQFRIDLIHEKYIAEASSLLEQALAFLGETITQPATENGLLLANYVATEKENVRQRLEAIVNDKARYAASRCNEEMFADEPYRLNALGKLEDLADCTPEKLTAYHRQWLSQAAIDIYVVGDTTLEQVRPLIQEHFKVERDRPVGYGTAALTDFRREPKYVTERLEVTQGKLNMGLRIPVRYDLPTYPVGLVFNGVLGAYAHSKLFINVREKASLAYYAASRLDGYKGTLMIQSGIEIDNEEKARSIILEQLEAVSKGEISDLEMNQTKALIENQLREMQDSAFEMTAFDFNGILSGKEREAETFIRDMRAVTKEQVSELAKQVQLDTVYFLTKG